MPGTVIGRSVGQLRRKIGAARISAEDATIHCLTTAPQDIQTGRLVGHSERSIGVANMLIVGAAKPLDRPTIAQRD
jgi:hypothetical protein